MRKLAWELSLALVILGSSSVALSGGMGISDPPESVTVVNFLPESAPFHPWRPLPLVSLAHRDLEFHWDALYTGGLTDSMKLTLNGLGQTITSSTSNPFGAVMSDIRLVYNYFRMQGSTYNSNDPNANDSTAVVLGNTAFYSDVDSYNHRDRSKSDYYLFLPGHNGHTGGQYPSQFQSDSEDVDTGHSPGDVKHANSVMMYGPPDNARLDVPGTGWTAPNKHANWGFNHEFQHSLPGSQRYGALSEIFSSGAEALGGETDSDPTSEVPYTWSLFANDHAATCTNLRAVGQNYQGWRSFSEYLVFNFPGLDTTLTEAGLNDDLMHRWARSDRSVSTLRSLLGNDSCGTCSAKNYFKNSDGSPMPNHDRMQLLLHNWRVANYVNAPFLDEGEYGFPPKSQFTPAVQLKAWQRFDACGDANDIVTVPPVVTMGSAQVTRETTFVRTRYYKSYSYPMRLQPFGAEYWVFRSDTASLGIGNKDLVVRVSAEAIDRCNLIVNDSRLLASVVAYTSEDSGLVSSDLWQHPEWAQMAIAPKWTDVDSTAGTLDFVVPGFGTTYKAALVIISLGDGPHEGYSVVGAGFGYVEVLPYRLTAALRTVPFDAASPQGLVQNASLFDDFPSWSPAGDEIALHSQVAGSYSQIFRKKLDSSAPTLLAPQAHNQFIPDWSPRGDFVAFDQDSGSGPTQCDIWLYDLHAGGSPTRLTFQRGVGTMPSFQPNGNGLAYVHQAPSGGPWELRWVDLSNLPGAYDQVLGSLGTGYAPAPVRWSPDGNFVYTTRHDTLLQIPSYGGAFTARPDLLSGASSFDFHRGVGRLLVEQTGTARCLQCSPSPAQVFRRLALIDTTGTPRDTIVRFYQRSGQFFNPRYSYDGTRIAYSLNQSVPADRDVYVGQINYDHPPKFVGLQSSYTAYACVPFRINLGATDPDGEAVTYKAAYRPTGSSFTGNQFYWASPYVGDYSVVFRALDGSGGLDNRVVVVHVIDTGACDGGMMAGGGGGGGGFRAGPTLESIAVSTVAPISPRENSMLDGAQVGGRSADLLSIPGLSPSAGGGYSIRIREGTSHSAALDDANLVTVDHSSEVRAFPCLGKVLLGARVAPTKANDGGGLDITSFIDGSGFDPYTADSGAAITVQLQADGLHSQPVVVEACRAAALSSQIVLEIPDGGGGWKAVTRIRPRQFFSEATVDSIFASQVRLEFVGGSRVRFVGTVARSSQQPTVKRYQPVSAIDAARGEVAPSLASSDTASVVLAGPDTLMLSFAAPPVAVGQIRECFLAIDATPLSPDVAPASSARGASATPLPAQFALRQNQPNPFSASTTIRFELPVSAAVRLEVFDIQGRRVRVVADGHYPAGYQAAQWDRRDEAGGSVRPGIYLYRLSAGAFRDERKLVLLP